MNEADVAKMINSNNINLTEDLRKQLISIGGDLDACIEERIEAIRDDIEEGMVKTDRLNTNQSERWQEQVAQWVEMKKLYIEQNRILKDISRAIRETMGR